uniref:Uncharacterized protein n=1 Tax=Glossina brevipalpis TaxID=37001 RepID=A0A1A9X1A5_9MUSC
MCGSDGNGVDYDDTCEWIVALAIGLWDLCYVKFLKAYINYFVSISEKLSSLFEVREFKDTLIMFQALYKSLWFPKGCIHGEIDIIGSTGGLLYYKREHGELKMINNFRHLKTFLLKTY